ncbi:hypothetical protein MESS2_350085 [Mesorhizobium metallidurans STM 2683]|uniref:Uncharacterized protein n=1 Tax=Mesorhizobium metallidurans STM 2683 TaxID=1297569 RepID=M5ERM7_9HYPH|nr:hypothetical protein [Mesorhizobium metallidurans]CCV06713.1 hypothetical protein MESS2_350085 [Mesorhizobium metallidurans STM 2683]
MNIGRTRFPNTIAVHVVPIGDIVELEAGRIKAIFTRFRSMIAPVAGKLGFHGSCSDQSHYDDVRGTLELCDKDVFAIISHYRCKLPHLTIQQFRLSTALLFGMSDDEFGAAWRRSLERIPDRLEPAGFDCGQQFYKQRVAGRSLAELTGENVALTMVLQ